MKLIAWLAAAGLLVACDDGGSGAAGVDGPGVAVTVAPLNVDSAITNAVYVVRVDNASDETLAELTIDADSYGDGASLASAVLPCDADPGEQPNKVYLTVVSFMTGEPPTPDAAIGVPAPLLLQPVTCLANQDVAVSFAPTIIESSGQGFFDIAISLDRMLCSAKLDCVDQGDQPLALLGDGSLPTVVLGFACAAGDDLGVDTTLLMDNVTLDCGAAGTAVLDPDAAGHLTEGVDMATGGLVFGAAVFRGEEGLTVLDKLYWNTAIGLNQTALDANCTLTGRATAVDGAPAGPPYATPADHPFVDWDAALTDASGSVACGRHPLGSAEVFVAYPSVANTSVSFDHVYGGPDPRVFATASLYGPSLFTANETAAALCQVEADAAGLEGAYVAWLPFSASQIADVPYRRVDGVTVATGWADLTDGTLAAPLNLDATGATVTGAAFTGLTAAGATATECAAGDWLTSSGNATVGDVSAVDATWSANGTAPCAGLHHLYCFPADGP